MKRVLIENSQLILFKILFVDSIAASVDEEYNIFSSTDIDDDFSDVYYMSWTDEQLSTLSVDEVQKINNIGVLVRLAKIDKKKLSGHQLQRLHTALGEHQPIDRNQIVNIIKMLRECESIEYNYSHRKTNNFLADHDIVDLKDCIPVLHSLKETDISQKFRGLSDEYLGDILLVFNPDEATFGNGVTVKNLGVYVKVDITKSNKCIILVSMHDPKYPMEHPLR